MHSQEIAHEDKSLLAANKAEAAVDNTRIASNPIAVKKTHYFSKESSLMLVNKVSEEVYLKLCVLLYELVTFRETRVSSYIHAIAIYFIIDILRQVWACI